MLLCSRSKPLTNEHVNNSYSFYFFFLPNPNSVHTLFFWSSTSLFSDLNTLSLFYPLLLIQSHSVFFSDPNLYLFTFFFALSLSLLLYLNLSFSFSLSLSLFFQLMRTVCNTHTHVAHTLTPMCTSFSDNPKCRNALILRIKIRSCFETFPYVIVLFVSNNFWHLVNFCFTFIQHLLCIEQHYLHFYLRNTIRT